MCVQLQYNNDFLKIIDSEEKPKYISKNEDIPIETIKKIVEEARKVVICCCDDANFYCTGCCKKLDENYYCKSCFRDYKTPCKTENSKYVMYGLLNNLKNFGQFRYNYFKFDIVDNEVLLYRMGYNGKYNIFNKEEYSITIDSVYLIRNDSVIELMSNRRFLYDELLEIVDNEYFDDDSEELASSHSFCDISFIDVDSLDLLKSSAMYKYSYIWLLKEYFKNNNFVFHSLVTFPVYVKQFEYLVKMGLYNLACIDPRIVEYKGNFVDTFQVDKKYYNFMKEIDITPNMLKVFRITKIFDVELLNIYAHNTDVIIDISNKTNINKVISYIKKNKISIFDYNDYLKKLEKLKMNLNDENYIFPKDFNKKFYEVILEDENLKNSDLNRRIRDNVTIFNINRYEDDTYIIFPPSSLASIYIEGYNQHNCLRDYVELYASNRSQLYFMRYKNRPNDSLVTVEVNDNKIKQAKCKYNKEPSEELWRVLKKWETSLVPIIYDN